ncbi:hypothetical protein HMPREF6485_1599 [Segatella buccae ATCC 33574]|uniref:Uncharacterized protein n=1 Tax=Segatella buccae ATCC 33574 TaxID=873513 RepID=E6K819_9BACT|nr:hypothetical protein HMPREF6485_1599 [Segatella buccae ATCC 33574]
MFQDACFKMTELKKSVTPFIVSVKVLLNLCKGKKKIINGGSYRVFFHIL